MFKSHDNYDANCACEEMLWGGDATMWEKKAFVSCGTIRERERERVRSGPLHDKSDTIMQQSLISFSNEALSSVTK